MVAAEQRAREAELRLADLDGDRTGAQDAAPMAAPDLDAAPTPEPAPRSHAPEETPGGDEAPDDDVVAPLSPDAVDLRSRLARTAARKRLGATSDEEHR